MSRRLTAAFAGFVFLSALGGLLGAGPSACPVFAAPKAACHCPVRDRDLTMKADCCCSMMPATPVPEPPASMAPRAESAQKPETRVAHFATAGPEPPIAAVAPSFASGAARPPRAEASVPLFLQNVALLR